MIRARGKDDHVEGDSGNDQHRPRQREHRLPRLDAGRERRHVHRHGGG